MNVKESRQSPAAVEPNRQALTRKTSQTPCFQNMEKLTMGQRQLAAWAGIIGTTLFVAIFTLEGWYRPGYEPLKIYVSALSLGPRGGIQILNFILFGVLLFVFSRGVAPEY